MLCLLGEERQNEKSDELFVGGVFEVEHCLDFLQPVSNGVGVLEKGIGRCFHVAEGVCERTSRLHEIGIIFVVVCLQHRAVHRAGA